MLVYYLLEVSLITFVTTSFGKFFFKKKAYYKMNIMDFFNRKNYNIKY